LCGWVCICILILNFLDEWSLIIQISTSTKFRKSVKIKMANQKPYMEDEQTIQWLKGQIIISKRNICVANDIGYIPLVVNTLRSFPHSRLITGFVTRSTRRVPLVEQELLTLPEHLGILSRISKNRQNTGQKKKYKRTNNDLQNIHVKLKIEWHVPN
jgi:hypothetical protein